MGVGQEAEHGDQVIGAGDLKPRNRELVFPVVKGNFFDVPFKGDRLKGAATGHGIVQCL